jgi:hypothetical protein
MTTCALVLGIISCTFAGPRTTPAEALAILAPHQFVYVPPLPPGPTVLILNSSSTAGPFGEFKPFSPSQRLDGSSFTDPPFGACYGAGCYGPLYGGPVVGFPVVSQPFLLAPRVELWPQQAPWVEPRPQRPPVLDPPVPPAVSVPLVPPAPSPVRR